MWARLVVLEPFVRLGNCLTFGVAQGVAILVGWDHCFHEVDHSSKLRRGKLVEQLMGALPIHLHTFMSIHGPD